MRWMVWVVVAAMGASCVKTERDYQLEHARSMTPSAAPVRSATSELQTGPQPPRVLTLRVFVDLDYQSQVLHWNDRVLAQLQSASDVLKAALNLELKVVSVETWNAHSANVPIEELLSRLESEDPAKDVDVVIGFVSSLEIFTDSQEKLGVAPFLGRHTVLRAMDNAAEHQNITRIFTKLTETEQATLYRQRKLHKERSVVLHEVGHLLGAPHDTAGDSLINPIYAAQRSRFTPAMLRLLVKSLELRDAKVDQKTRARALGEFIAASNDLALEDRPNTLKLYEDLAKGDSAATKRASAQQDFKTLGAARRLHLQDKNEEAMRLLEPLMQRADPSVEAVSMACQISGVMSLTEPLTTQRCQRAVQLDADDASALMMLAQAQAATRDVTGARATFIAAKERFDAHKDRSIEHEAAYANVSRTLGFVTWAETYSARGTGRVSADEVLEWVKRRRRWYGLPANVTAPQPRDEPAYLDRFLEVQNRMTANRLKEADAAISLLESDFPTLPGPATLRCELELRRQNATAARSACERALKDFPESLEAHYLLGILASHRADHRAVVEHFEAVLAEDATVDDAWQYLTKSYAALKDNANRERTAKHQPK